MHAIIRNAALAVAALLGLSGTAGAATLSYTGTIQNDDDVALIHFVVNAPSNATIRTFSYAGGVQGNGNAVPAGGFDPLVSLFDGGGKFIDFVDDAFPGTAPSDPSTGEAFDAVLSAALAPGAYFAAISQSDNNFLGGPGDSIGLGFDWDGVHDFTSIFGCAQGHFCDHTGADRSNSYAFDIELSPVPVPPALPLMGGALLALSGLVRRRTGA